MSARAPLASPAAAGSRRPATTALLAGALGLVGLLSGFPFLLGAAIGLAGAFASAYVRRRPRPPFPGAAPVPALAALVVLLLYSAPVPSTELFGGLAALAVLLWLADDPHAAPGGGRRAATSIGFAAFAFALAWGFLLALAPLGGNVGVAAVLTAVALLVVTVVLARTVAPPQGETA